jgi:hypothetical protein
MKGFIWNIESTAQFRDVVKDDYSRIIYVDRKVNELYGVEIEYLTDFEKQLTADASKKGKTDIHKDDVSYYINNYGARGDWSIEEQKDDHLNIAVFGCSFTFGVGLPENKTWAAQFVQKLQVDKPVQLINLGYPGGSIAKNLKHFKYLTDIYKIDMAVFLLPTHWREEYPEYYTSDYPVHYYNFIPNFAIEYQKEKWEQYYSYSTDGTRFYDMVKMISYIELIASVKNIETYYSSWDEQTLNFIREHKLVKLHQILPYFKFLENMLGPHLSNKYARDGSHPGIASQDLFSSELVDHISSKTLIQGITKKIKVI